MEKNGPIKDVVVTGGAGYVGSVLIPKLLAAGHRVRVVDLYIYGEDVLDSVKDNPGLTQIKGDIRNRELMEKALAGADAVIHLACISNDPSYELNPQLGKSINYDAFVQLAELSRLAGIRRFIYASTSSVYGVKEEENVTEDLRLEPLTDYSKYKALCEEHLLGLKSPGFDFLILRPATVCGYSPRLRLDLSVNILTNHAVNKGKITIFGGEQARPNIHIEDMTDLYVKSLAYPAEKINRKIFNAGYQNLKMKDIAVLVRAGVASEMNRQDIELATTPTDDNRSYRISSEKIRSELGFTPARTIEDAVRDLCRAFKAGKVPDPLTNPRYFNIKTMQALNLQ